jgi:hypothetical protein
LVDVLEHIPALQGEGPQTLINSALNAGLGQYGPKDGLGREEDVKNAIRYPDGNIAPRHRVTQGTREHCATPNTDGVFKCVVMRVAKTALSRPDDPTRESPAERTLNNIARKSIRRVFTPLFGKEWSGRLYQTWRGSLRMLAGIKSHEFEQYLAHDRDHLELLSDGTGVYQSGTVHDGRGRESAWSYHSGTGIIELVLQFFGVHTMPKDRPTNRSDRATRWWRRVLLHPHFQVSFRNAIRVGWKNTAFHKAIWSRAILNLLAAVTEVPQFRLVAENIHAYRGQLPHLGRIDPEFHQNRTLWNGNWRPLKAVQSAIYGFSQNQSLCFSGLAA